VRGKWPCPDPRVGSIQMFLSGPPCGFHPNVPVRNPLWPPSKDICINSWAPTDAYASLQDDGFVSRKTQHVSASCEQFLPVLCGGRMCLKNRFCNLKLEFRRFKLEFNSGPRRLTWLVSWNTKLTANVQQNLRGSVEFCKWLMYSPIVLPFFMKMRRNV
jgi:hypothetical protein